MLKKKKKNDNENDGERIEKANVVETNRTISVLSIYENNKIFAGCKDGFLQIWDLKDANENFGQVLNENEELTKIIIIPESESKFMVSDYVNDNDKAYRIKNQEISYFEKSFEKIFEVWNFDSLKLITSFKKPIEKNELHSLTDIVFSKNYKKLMIGTEDGEILIYDINKNFELECVLISPENENSPVISITETPDPDCQKIITVHKRGDIFIWNVKLQLLCCKIPIKAPTKDFVFHQKSLAINGFCALDLKNDMILFDNKISKNIRSFFFDKNYNLIILNEKNKNEKVIEYSALRPIHYMNTDLTSLKNLIVGNKNFSLDQLINKNEIMLPFKFNFLHILCIMESFEMFGLKELENIKWQAFLELKIPLKKFFYLDFRDKTCLDILIDKKNKTVMSLFMKKIFEAINYPESTFYEKLKFFSYDFNSEKNFFQIINKFILF